MEEMTTLPEVITIKEPYFGGDYTDGLMVHKITKRVFVDPMRKAIKIQRHSITNSTVRIVIVTIMKGKTISAGVGWILK